MADMLAEVGDLSSLLQEDIDPDVEALLLELATGEVQSAAGQRLLRVEDDRFELLGTTESWLDLPERPVVSVDSVEVDGEEVTDWQRHGSRLFRAGGWSSRIYEPSTVSGVYTHGYADGDPGLAFARKQTLGLAAFLWANPTGATGLSIDDYREQYSQAADGTGSVLPRPAQRALRRRYGRRTGLVRVG